MVFLCQIGFKNEPGLTSKTNQKPNEKIRIQCTTVYKIKLKPILMFFGSILMSNLVCFEADLALKNHWFWYGFGMILVWFWFGFGLVWVWVWYGFGMVLVWFWYGFGMVLVWFWYDYGMVYLLY